jgi:hypothetical protein
MHRLSKGACQHFLVPARSRRTRHLKALFVCTALHVSGRDIVWEKELPSGCVLRRTRVSASGTRVRDWNCRKQIIASQFTVTEIGSYNVVESRRNVRYDFSLVQKPSSKSQTQTLLDVLKNLNVVDSLCERNVSSFDLHHFCFCKLALFPNTFYRRTGCVL